MWLKLCPKCGGDLYLRQEIDGCDIVCMQCGYNRLSDPGSDEPDSPAVSKKGRRSPSGKRRVAA